MRVSEAGEGVMKTIPLTKGYVALVDDEDYLRVSCFHWQAQVRSRGTVYAKRIVGIRPHKRGVYLHRFILGISADKKVDHRDGNGLNCQRSNLRAATHSENLANRPANANSSTSIKGVYLRRGAWEARLTVRGKQLYLGRFATAEEAERVYQQAAREHFGEFAYQYPAGSSG